MMTNDTPRSDLGNTTTLDEDENHYGSSGLLDVAAFSPGITLIFTVHVAMISATIGRYRAALKELCRSNTNDDTHGNQERLLLTYPQAKQVICTAALQVVFVFVILLFVCAVAITQMTDPLDQRMMYIINGLSRLTAAVLMALLSFKVAFWVELYHPIDCWTAIFQTKMSQHDEPCHFTSSSPLLLSEPSLSRAVHWSVAKKFLRSFVLLLVLFQEGADTIVTIPASIVTGMVTGLFLDYAVYKCRRLSHRARLRKFWTVTLVLLLACFSVACFDSGVFFIATVWDDDQGSFWPAVALVTSLVGFPLLHLVVWQCGKISANKDPCASNNASTLKQIKHCTVTSMVFDEYDDDEQEQMERDVEIEVDHSTISQNHGDMANEIDAYNCDNYGEESDETSSGSPKHIGDEINETGFIKDWILYGCVRGSKKTAAQKMHDCTTWTIYIFVCFACIFVLIANVGSTRQQQAAKAKLPYVHEKLYRYIDEGPVCAFDNKGADSNITTFVDNDAAHKAGFLVLHCGACGACSDWHNLELEYTTRNFLALESRKCAQKTLWGGERNDLIKCLESDKIGFQGQCAKCWADDILCTKKFCAFIGIQSFLINTLGNFEVGEDTITAAACEEAHCEAGNPGHFVACSGATRRRMNVKSTISRPGSQQCGIVDVTWSDLFPNPHPNNQ